MEMLKYYTGSKISLKSIKNACTVSQNPQFLVGSVTKT